MLVSALSLHSAFAQTSDALKVKTFTLDNGLTVWLNEDPNQVSVYGAVVVKAGAVDCPETGIAHYFEHMMFKGTDKIGTTDYAAEKPYLDSIAVKYDELALAQDDGSKKAIQMEINRLSVKAADYAIPNEFDNLIADMGGSGLNAFTSYDETVYHNMFLPEYFEQWAEINSERIMNPVFRLFQSELETVYEEKNRADDNLISDFQDRMLENVYKGTGYSADIVGTTDNLKNPRLSQMREFFETKYVASNMGLVLTGNITEAQARPIIEKTFGRIRQGEPSERNVGTLEPIKGRQDVYAKINMPIVKLGAICFRGPSKTDSDFLGVSFLTFLLNNDAGTGLLDKLMVDKKLMMAMAMPDLSFREAGSVMVLYMPKLLFQKESKATALIMDTFKTLKEGDFSDEYFESCKLSFKKVLVSQTEDLSERMQQMVFALSDNLDWNEIIARSEKIDAMTKEDLVNLANKYFTEDYILIHKEKGLAQKDKLEKPDYEKIVPKNREASSAYAMKLRESANGIKVLPKAVDYENDVQTVTISSLAKLYASKNPYNDVFNLTLKYNIGTMENPTIERMTAYVNLLGTEEKSFDDIHSELQELGSSIAFISDDNSFSVNLSGFDENLDKTLEIASDLMKNIKGERKKLSNMKAEEKANLIMSRSDIDALGEALQEKVLFSEKSKYLQDKGAFSDKVLLGLFKDVQDVECDVLYSGTLDGNDVAAMLDEHFDLDAISRKSNAPIDFSPVKYDGEQIFFVNKKKASQSHIRCVLTSEPIETLEDRYAAGLYTTYLGGGMTSLLFQEIREFRSMAYSTYASLNRPYFINSSANNCALVSFVGTQCDKTIEAMAIVDSLVTKTPFNEGKIAIQKQQMLNSRANTYPSFREMPKSVAEDLRTGFTYDPVDVFMSVIEGSNAETLKAYWEKYFAGKNRVWGIVGNEDKIDMEALEAIAPVTKLKPSQLMK